MFYDKNISHVEVFYIGGKTGWCMQPYDKQDCPLNGAQYAWSKKNAIGWAHWFGTPDIRVFRRDGTQESGRRGR